MASLVVRSKIKEAAGIRVAGNLADALDKKVAEMLKIAEERAKANGRSTIRPCDL